MRYVKLGGINNGPYWYHLSWKYSSTILTALNLSQIMVGGGAPLTTCLGEVTTTEEIWNETSFGGHIVYCANNLAQELWYNHDIQVRALYYFQNSGLHFFHPAAKEEKLCLSQGLWALPSVLSSQKGTGSSQHWPEKMCLCNMCIVEQHPPYL